MHDHIYDITKDKSFITIDEKNERLKAYFDLKS